MTTIKTFICTAALCVASAAFAQSSNTCSWFPKGDEDGQGTIGKRYVDAGLSAESLRHTAHNIGGANLGVNLPLTSLIDISGGYDYNWENIPVYNWWYNNNEGYSVEKSNIHLHNHRASSNITFYNVIENGIRPFVSVGLERNWTDSSGAFGNYAAETRNGWNVSAGAEFPYKWISVTPRVSYQDDFKTSSRSFQAWGVGAEVSAWITHKIGAYVNVTFYDTLHTADDNWVIGAGVRFRF
jgi:hypothetical protein